MDVNLRSLLPMMVLVVLVLPVEAGEGPLFPVPVLPVGKPVVAVEVVDLDGDGLPDLAAAVSWYGGDEIALWRGTEDHGLVPAGTLPTTRAVRSLRSGDINGDGHMDLVALSPSEGRVSVFFGRGDGTLEAECPFVYGPAGRVFSGAFPQALAVADLDGDGLDEVIVVDTFELFILRSIPSGFLETTERLSAGDRPVAVTVARLDGDDYPDVIVVAQNTGALFLFHGEPDGGLASPEEVPMGIAPQAIVATDLDGDGRPDLAVSDFLARNHDDGGEVWVALADGAGSFRPAVPHQAERNPIDIVAGDLTGDGIPDLITSNLSSADISVLVGLGDGTFEPQRKAFAGRVPVRVTLADFDHDGLLDVAVAAAGTLGIPILPGNGTGELDINLTLPLPARPTGVHAGDFNGDGHMDIAAASSEFFVGLNHSLFLFNGRGDGSFAVPVRFDVGRGPGRAVVGRLNDDDLDDLALVNHESDDVSILAGHPTQGFSKEVRVAVGRSPIQIVAGDLDGDGTPELIVANNDSRDLSVLRRAGGDFLVGVTTVAVGERPTTMAVIPHVKDRGVDLAVGFELPRPGGELRLFTAGGGGGLAEIGFMDLVDRPNGMAASLLGRDVLADLVVAFFLPQFEVFHNVRRGFPGRRGVVDVTLSYVSEITVADVNGDGFRDLLVLHGRLQTISVFRGTGGRHLGPEERYLLSRGARAMSLADFDGDGDPDLALAGISLEEITIVPNLSSGR